LCEAASLEGIVDFAHGDFHGSRQAGVGPVSLPKREQLACHEDILRLEGGGLQHRVVKIFAIREFGNTEKECVLYVTIPTVFAVPTVEHIRELRMSSCKILGKMTFFSSIFTLAELEFCIRCHW
jgi:hypothetical protein